MTQRPGQLVGIGRTAEVFAYGEGRVVKVLRPGFPDQMADDEARVAERVASAYAAAPRCDGVVRVDGRAGIVYERTDGPSMDVRARSRLWEVDRLARRLGALHAAMHDLDGHGLPDQRAAIHASIDRASVEVSASDAAEAHARVDRLPTGSGLCHGDLHPGNVLLGDREVVIDWGGARSGSPAADVARSMFLMRDAAMPEPLPGPLALIASIVRARFCRTYLATYLAARPLDPAEIVAWRFPILVARLAEGIVAERPAIRREIERTRASRERS